MKNFLCSSYGGTGRSDGSSIGVYSSLSSDNVMDRGFDGYAIYSKNTDATNITKPSVRFIKESTEANHFPDVGAYGVCFSIGKERKANPELTHVLFTGTSNGRYTSIYYTDSVTNIGWYPIIRNCIDHNIYISPNGDDKNTGCNINTPIKTITRLKNILVTLNCSRNLTIYFDKGDWGSVTFSNDIRCELLAIRGWDFTNNVALTSGDLNNYPYFTQIVFYNLHYFISGIKVEEFNCVNSHGYAVSTNPYFGHVFLLASSLESNNQDRGMGFYETSDTIDHVVTLYSSRFRCFNNLINTATGANSNNFFGGDSGSEIQLVCTVTGGDLYTKPKYSTGTMVTVIYPSRAPGIDNPDHTNTKDPKGYFDIVPFGDNVRSLGIQSSRWAQLYAGTATINTSDEREKLNITTIPDNVLDAWGEVEFNLFQYKEAVDKKGTSARLHSALVAQRIKSIFERNGLDATRYGLLCYDEWPARDWQEQVGVEPAVYKDIEVVDIPASGDQEEISHIEQELVTPEKPIYETHHEEAGSRYGIRYEEALCIEAAYQRRRADRLEARIAALEAKLGE